jgi:hypothetical protein
MGRAMGDGGRVQKKWLIAVATLTKKTIFVYFGGCFVDCWHQHGRWHTTPCSTPFPWLHETDRDAWKNGDVPSGKHNPNYRRTQGMAGKAKRLIDSIMTQRSKGNPAVAKVVKAKFVLKRIGSEEFSGRSADDPTLI